MPMNQFYFSGKAKTYVKLFCVVKHFYIIFKKVKITYYLIYVSAKNPKYNKNLTLQKRF